METQQAYQKEAGTPAFAAMHPTPLVVIPENLLGKMIPFDAADGKKANAYFIAAKKKSNKFLIIIQEWWGLNDNVKMESDKYYTDLGDVNVIAVDMYDGKVAATPDSAMKLIYCKMVFALDSEVSGFKGILNQELSKNDSLDMRKANINEWTKSIDKFKSIKDDLVKSQQEWEKERDHNFNVISALVEGGSGFVEFENQSLIDDTLERIKKLLTFMDHGIPPYHMDNTIGK